MENKRITLKYAKEQLSNWLEAQEVLSTGVHSYTIGTRTLTRVNLKEALRMISYWEDRIRQLESGRNRGTVIKRGVPRDL